MRRFIQTFILIGVITSGAFAQCPFNLSGVVTNLTCNGSNDGAVNLSVAGGASGNPPVYCMPGYTQPGCNCTATWDFINNFWTTGGSTNITNLNSGCNGVLPNNYHYFVGMVVSVMPGGSFGVNIQCAAPGTGCSSTYQHGMRIWVDWNNDGDYYDANENAYNTGTSGFQVFSGTITCPIGTACGLKRMRARSAWISVPSDPCNTLSYGECEEYDVMVGSPYTYLWSNGATTEDISNLAAGTYIVTVTSGATSAQDTFIITQPLPLLATITAGGPTTFCQGDSVILTASGAGATSFTWSNGSTLNPLTALSSGIYSVTATTPAGCNSIATINVTVNPSPPAPNISAAGSTNFCIGGSVTLTSDAGAATVWQPSGIIGSTLTVNVSGNYTATITDAFGCSSSSAPTIVNVVPLPVATITPSGPTTFCQGNSVTLTSNYPTGNTWSTGATSSSINVNAAGNYSFIVDLGNGCIDTSVATAVAVNPNPTPTITPSGVTSFCQGGSVTLTSNYAGGNSWSTGANTASINVLSSGSYTLTVTDANGCTGTAGPQNVTVNPIPAAPIITPSGPTTFCAGGTVTLSSNYPSGNLWSSGVNTSSITVFGSGTFSVTYTDNNGCTSPSSSIQITVNPVPTAAITASTLSLCLVNTLTVAYNGTASASAAYNWDFDGATVLSGSGQGPYNLSFPAAGNYTITVDVTENGCTSPVASANITVYNNPTSSFTISDDTICSGETVSLQYSGNAGSTANYIWDPGAGIISSGSGQGPISVVINAPGTNTVSLQVSENGCASVTTNQSVFVNALPQVIMNAAPHSACDSLTTVISTSTPGVSYSWNISDGTTETSTSFQHYFGNGVYDVTLTVTDANGCSKTLTQPGYIVVLPTPVAAFSYKPTTDSAVDLSDAVFYFTNLSSNAFSYNWDFGDNLPSSLMNPYHQYFDTGSFHVTLYAINELGCYDSASAGPFIVKEDPSFFIPNAFTPNGDELNDVWKVYGARLINVDINIFDRTGELVGQIHSINDSWDGTFLGKKLNTGVFVYSGVIQFDTTKKKKVRGDINLFR